MHRNILYYTYVLCGIALALSLAVTGCSITPRDTQWRSLQEGKTALMLAIENRDLAQVTRLVKMDKVDINVRCDAVVLTTVSLGGGRYYTASSRLEKQGSSALSIAILNRDAEMVRLLVDAGADTKATVIYENAQKVMQVTQPTAGSNSTDFSPEPEKRATILALAKQSHVAAIIAIIKQHQ